MKKETVTPEISKDVIAQATEEFIKKYNVFVSMLSPTEIELIIQQAVNELPKENDINATFLIPSIAERIFLVKARDEILDGNIELEILFVEKYMTTAKFLLRQIKYNGENSNQLAEDGIIRTIENYQGELSFKRALLATLKDMLNPKKEVVEDNKVVEENKIVKDSEKLIIPNDDIVRTPNQLELLIHEADILKKVPLDDPIYVKFLTLKYGYHQNQYYDLEEISKILSISIEQSKEYYQQSLQYLKDWFGIQLDKTFTYCTQKSE